MYKLKVKYYRHLNHLTQKKLAYMVGVKQSYIARLENETLNENVTLHVLEKLSNIFKVSLNELTGSVGKYIPLLFLIYVIK